MANATDTVELQMEEVDLKELLLKPNAPIKIDRGEQLYSKAANIAILSMTSVCQRFLSHFDI